MRVLSSLLLDAVWGAAIVALALVVLLTAAHARGYRLSLYTAHTCVPAPAVEPGALSPNPMRAIP
jgi:steroid 5-alpha reductase family enzyme